MDHKVGGAYLSSEVQLGQRLAFKLMLVKQYGHSLVVTAGAGAGLEALAIPRSIRKTTKAMMMKLMMVLINTP